MGIENNIMKTYNISNSQIIKQGFPMKIMGKRDLMSDAIHPNSRGYSIMANHFYKALKPYLN